MPQQLKQALWRDIGTLPAQHDSLYLLLDGALLDAPLVAYSNDDNPIVEPLYRGTRHEPALLVSPCLVKPSALSKLWQQQDQWRSKGVVLYCQEPIASLRQHLQSLISVRLPSQQLAYCRYYSPAWLASLLDTLSPAEVSSWSGPIKGWYAYFDNSWSCAEVDAPGEPRKLKDEGWFVLKQQQLDHWQTQEYQRFVDKAAEHLGCYTSSSEAGRRQRAAVAALTREAHEFGFLMEYQCLHYLELAWRFPKELVSPLIAGMLRNPEQQPDQRLQLAEQQLFGLNKDV